MGHRLRSTATSPRASRRPWNKWSSGTSSSRASTATIWRTVAPRCSRRPSPKIRRRRPGTSVEVLIPDFKGSERALRIVVEAKPDILNHNLETIERLYRLARPGGRYSRALELLRRAKEMDAGTLTKSGIICGLGEDWDELLVAMRDLRAQDVDILTVGQYLRPSSQHLPIARYYTPDEFAALRRHGLDMGYRHVEAGPLVRSSYHAWEQVERATATR